MPLSGRVKASHLLDYGGGETISAGTNGTILEAHQLPGTGGVYVYKVKFDGDTRPFRLAAQQDLVQI